MISSDFRTEARRKLDGKWGKAALVTLAFAFINFLLAFIESCIKENSVVMYLFSIAQVVISIPLSFGFIIALFKLYKNETVAAFDFLSLGFSNLKKSWSVTFRIALKLIVPIIVVIVAYILIIIAATNYSVNPITYSHYDIDNSVYNLSYSVSSFTSTGLIFVVVALIIMTVGYIWLFTKSYYYKLAYLVAIDNEDLTAKEAVDQSEKIMTGKRAKLFWLELSFIGWAILSVFTFGIGMLWLIPYIQFATILFYFFANGNNTVVETSSEKTTDKIEE